MPLLPRAHTLLNPSPAGAGLLPQYLTESDEPWLRLLLDEYARWGGRKAGELRQHLHAVRAPKAKLAVAAHVLDSMSKHRTTAPVPPREARALLFRAAATGRERAQVRSEVAGTLGITQDELDAALFADLPGERRVAALPDTLTALGLRLEANLVIVSTLLRRAARVHIEASGNTGQLVQYVRRRGLICQLTPGAGESSTDSMTLEVSGPFTLFRHTQVYGRALAALVPRAACCDSFELRAACALGRGPRLSTVLVRAGDPLAPVRELAAYDDRVERRFAEDLRRATRDWLLVSEPTPIAAGASLLVPDFELHHRSCADRRWRIEIVGFWTPEYLRRKLRALDDAGLDWLLCVDEERRCRDAELPAHPRVVGYTKRIDPLAVLARVERGAQLQASPAISNST